MYDAADSRGLQLITSGVRIKFRMARMELSFDSSQVIWG